MKCLVKNCISEIKGSGRYICSRHTRKEQWKALGRKPDERKDTVDINVHFQDHQFDKDLRRGRRPVDTDHIQRQGSEIDDQQERLDLNEEYLEGLN
jgi:hypothetical protein